MNLRIEIGGAWFEVYLFEKMFAGAWIFFQIKYGYYSTKNLVSVTRDHSGKTSYRFGEKKRKKKKTAVITEKVWVGMLEPTCLFCTTTREKAKTKYPLAMVGTWCCTECWNKKGRVF